MTREYASDEENVSAWPIKGGEALVWNFYEWVLLDVSNNDESVCLKLGIEEAKRVRDTLTAAIERAQKVLPGPGPVDVSAHRDVLGCSWPHFVLRSGEAIVRFGAGPETNPPPRSDW